LFCVPHICTSHSRLLFPPSNFSRPHPPGSVDLNSFPTRRSSDLERVLVNQQRVFDASHPKGGDLLFVVDHDAHRDAGYVHLPHLDRKSTRPNSSHVSISYAVFCLKKKTLHFMRTLPTGSVDPNFG